jgi:hypothetical protein
LLQVFIHQQNAEIEVVYPFPQGVDLRLQLLPLQFRVSLQALFTGRNIAPSQMSWFSSAMTRY